ncbi:MAG: DUF1553 domain-containing protein, partial [Planctomycetaceae bacterium]|nr:DUF1553 domain-containing protein [Planctomycetaceae bacterium]
NHPDAHVATHFCVAGPDMPDINSQEERRHVLLNELTSTVGEVVLGLQVGCAECHDHKYDPISQADFYRLRSVFEPAIQLRKNVSVRTLVETAPYQQSSHVMIRGDFQRPGPKIQPAPLRLFRSTLSDVTASEMELAFRANRRKALADWVTQPDHPLTARVIVNRLWQQHFGRGLSESPSDFGIMGQEPTHPELLDWLANWFVDNGWSIRKFHRLILTSAVWQQQSRFTGNADSTAATQWHQALREDPDARLLSRFPRQRLSGEVIRDSMLAVSDSLNRKTGGPGIRPPLPQELTSTLLKNQWDVTEDDSEHRRRSIYIFARRNLRFPIFEAFDRPAANDSCPVRNVSTTAPQSLYLLNSDFTLECAQRLADVMKAEHDTVTEQVNEVFRKVFSRHPTVDELQQVEAFLQQSPADSGLTHLCLSLFNSNEFVFLE